MTGEPLPRYVQISEMLIRDIAAGRLVDGARLPPERRMAQDLDVSVGTLRKALDDLSAKGLMNRVQGSGNYIVARASVPSIYAMFRLETLAGGGLPTARVLSVELHPKPVGVPEFGPSDQGFRIRRLRYLDDAPVAVEEIWLDGSRCDAIDVADLSDSLYLYYRTRLGLVIGHAEDRIGLDAVPSWAPEAFDLAPETPAPLIERVSWAQDGVPAEYSRTWFDNHKARYVSRLGKG